MPTFKLKAIPEPEEGTRAVIVSPSAPLIRGDSGDRTYICGGQACDIALVVKIGPDNHITNLVLKCPVCGTFNDATF